MPRDSRPAGMRLFGVTIAPAPEADPPERDLSPTQPVAAREDVMRKCKSMGNLAALGAGADGGGGGGDGGGAGDGYLSDGGLMQSSGKRRRAQERKKAVPWTEEEHRTFLAGLEKLGKGDWRGIAKNFVTTRTPTQVASHAQKYFLRQTNPNKKKRRSSLFDMMPRELSPTPNCPMLPPSMAKVHDVVAMTKQLQNSNLEGASSSIAANVASQVGRDLPPVPSFKATNIDSSFSKFSHMERYWRTPYPFRPIPRAPEGTPSSTPVVANMAVPASQANLTACTSTFLSQRGDTSSLPPKGDPPSEEDFNPSSTPVVANIAVPASQANLTACTSTLLSQRGDTSSLPPKGDPSSEEDLELTVAPPSQQQNMTNMSSQNAVGVIQVI